MSSRDVSSWVQAWGPLVTLASAVLLALVTAWLAWVTMRMAKGAKDAAEYSKTAAEASLASAAAMQASVPVEFTLSPTRSTKASKIIDFLKDEVAKGFLGEDQEVDLNMFDSITTIDQLGLRCDGSAVYIRGGRIVEICREPESANNIRCEATNIVLAPSTISLPHRLHKNEAFSFDVPGFHPGEWIVRITAIIDYSFDGQTIQQRLVVWRKPPRKARNLKSIETHGRAKRDDK
jgi:hypothetical protein